MQFNEEIQAMNFTPRLGAAEAGIKIELTTDEAQISRRLERFKQ
jgi:hypothetical protein